MLFLLWSWHTEHTAYTVYPNNIVSPWGCCHSQLCLCDTTGSCVTATCLCICIPSYCCCNITSHIFCEVNNTFMVRYLYMYVQSSFPYSSTQSEKCWTLDYRHAITKASLLIWGLRFEELSRYDPSASRLAFFTQNPSAWQDQGRSIDITEVSQKVWCVKITIFWSDFQLCLRLYGNVRGCSLWLFSMGTTSAYV